MYFKSKVTDDLLVEGALYQFVSEFVTGDYILIVNGAQLLVPSSLVTPHVGDVIRVDFSNRRRLPGPEAA